MIIVRVGLARDQALSGGSAEQSGIPSQRGMSFGFRQSRPPYLGQSLAVEITQFIETDHDASEAATPIELKTGSNKLTESTSSQREDFKA